MEKIKWVGGLFLTVIILASANPVQSRIKLAALPERGVTVIRLDNPQATLIEEERVLTLQKGVNRVDFSWKGVSIDPDSIRLKVLSHPDEVTLLNVSYPPSEAALVWAIHAKTAGEATVRISYLLAQIDRLVAYKGVADRDETHIDLKSYLILRNFSGEDFEKATVYLDEARSFEQKIVHEETSQILFAKQNRVPMKKIWTFDAARLPWDPEKIETNLDLTDSIFRIDPEKDR